MTTKPLPESRISEIALRVGITDWAKTVKDDLQAAVDAWFAESPQRPIAQFLIQTLEKNSGIQDLTDLLGHIRYLESEVASWKSGASWWHKAAEQTVDERNRAQAQITDLKIELSELKDQFALVNDHVVELEAENKRLSSMVKTLEEHDHERREAHAILTGKFSTGFAMTHPSSAPDTDLGKAAAALLTRVEAYQRKIDVLKKALGFYANPSHWMSLREDGDQHLLTAHGLNFDGTSNGWVEARAALGVVEGETK